MLKQLLFLWLVTSPLMALADGSELVLYVRIDGAPKQYLNQDGQTAGYAAEIAIKAIEMAGYQPKIVHIPWKRALTLSRDGYGLITGFSRISEREKDYYFSEKLFVDQIVLVQNASNQFPFNSLDDLASKRIGINTGSYYGDEFELKRDRMNLILDTGNDSRIHMLKRDRIDAGIFPGGHYTIKYLANSRGYNLEQFVVLDKPITTDDNFIGVPKMMYNHKSSDVLTRINKAIISMREQGMIKQIIAKYE